MLDHKIINYGSHVLVRLLFSKTDIRQFLDFLMEVFRAKGQFFCPPHWSIRIQGVFGKFLTI